MPSRVDTLGPQTGFHGPDDEATFVASNGDVYPSRFPPLRLGTIREQSLVEISAACHGLIVLHGR